MTVGDLLMEVQLERYSITTNVHERVQLALFEIVRLILGCVNIRVVAVVAVDNFVSCAKLVQGE